MTVRTDKLRNDVRFLEHLAHNVPDVAQGKEFLVVANGLSAAIEHYVEALNGLNDTIDEYRRCVKAAQEHQDYDDWYEGFCDGMRAQREDCY